MVKPMRARRGWFALWIALGLALACIGIRSGYGLLSSQPDHPGWSRQTKEGLSALTSLAFADRHHGWAVGADTTVLHTTNDGKSWATPQHMNMPRLRPGLMFNDIYFVAPHTGWICGEDGLILKTVDGGRNWSKQRATGNGLVGALAFVDSRRGWAIENITVESPFPDASYSRVLSTDNGGATWEAQDYPAVYPLTSICFVDGRNGWIAGSNTILHTVNGGKSWVKQRTPVEGDFHGIFFLDTRRGWVAGNGFLLHTDDAGETWVEHKLAKYELMSVYFSSPRVGWVVGSEGVILNTTDGGKSWNRQNSGTVYPLYSVLFRNRNEGWAIGNGTTILHTASGGRSTRP